MITMLMLGIYTSLAVAIALSTSPSVGLQPHCTHDRPTHVTPLHEACCHYQHDIGRNASGSKLV